MWFSFLRRKDNNYHFEIKYRNKIIKFIQKPLYQKYTQEKYYILSISQKQTAISAFIDQAIEVSNTPETIQQNEKKFVIG